jgi:putative LPS biosynthesis related DNTP-hexose dehydratase-epimerase
MEKEILYLIGGSGFIGKNLVRCLSPYYQITVFDKYIDYDFFCCYPEVATVVMDLATEKIAAEYPTPSFIINLASIVTAERDLSLFDGLISSNLKILLNLYDRFKGDDSLRLFIQFGSSEEYGSKGSPFVETQRERPNSPYALVKQLTTNTAIMLYDNYGFPTMVVRPGNLFGPGQNKSKFIPYVIEQLRKGEPLNVSPCEQRRDFIHVDVFSLDIHGLLKHADRVVGQIVNVSSGQSISLRQIIDFYKEALHSTSEINYGALSYRENEAMDLRCNIGKLLMIVNTEHDEMSAFKSLIKE